MKVELNKKEAELLRRMMIQNIAFSMLCFDLSDHPDDAIDEKTESRYKMAERFVLKRDDIYEEIMDEHSDMEDDKIGERISDNQ